MTKVFLLNALSGGGAEKVVLSLCKGFASDDNEVHLILVYKDEFYDLPENIKVYYLFENKPRNKMEKILFLPKAVRKLRKVISKIKKEKEIDLFTSHLPLSNYIAWLSRIKNHYGVIHSTYSKKYKGISKLIISLILRNKKLIAVSEGIRNDLIHNFHLDENNIVTIYNPVDIDFITKKSKEKISYDKPYIIHVGRLTKLKRQDLLIDAYSKSHIKDKYDLLLLGEGEERYNLEQQIKKLKLKDKVKLLGWQANPYKWIKNASLLVLCSEYEGLPTVLIESLVCKTPVVSTDCDSGPREILVDELSNYLVPVNDIEALRKKMEEALRFYPEIKPKYYERFSIKKILEDYNKLGGILNE